MSVVVVATTFFFAKTKKIDKTNVWTEKMEKYKIKSIKKNNIKNNDIQKVILFIISGGGGWFL